MQPWYTQRRRPLLVSALLLLTLALTLAGVGRFAVHAAVTGSAPMKLSKAALARITRDFDNGAYPAMYSVASSDLSARYPNATGADADVIRWLQIAQQVNSGAKTFNAIAIRAVNAAATQYELGESIGLFGTQEQAASNTIAKGFFAGIQPDGTVQTFDQIIQNDALSGLGSLGLSKAAWAGALPHAAVKIFTGFTTDNYYNQLSTSEQQEADLLHVIAGDITLDYMLGEKLGLSEATIDNITATDTIIDLELAKPVENVAAQLEATGTVINPIDTILNSLAMHVKSSSLLSSAETDIETMFGADQGVDASKDLFQVGGDINLDLSNSSASRFSLYLSSNNGELTIQDTPIVQDVTFLDTSGVLLLKDPHKYTGVLYNFSAGDTIDLASIGATSATLGANNVLAVKESDGRTLHLDFDPKQDLAGKNFIVSSDGNGGTDISVASGYTITDIAVPEAGATLNGINNAGQMVGGYYYSGLPAFVGTPGNFTSFDSPPSLGNYNWDDAVGINNFGQMIGVAGLDDYANQTNWLDSGGTFTAITVPKSQGTSAYGINDSEEIVGQYADTTSNAGLHGFLYSSGAYTTIDVPGAAETNAYGINNAGKIVGYYLDSNDNYHGFTYSSGVYTTIDVPGATFTTLGSINNNGEILGDSSLGNFLYDGKTFTMINISGRLTGINDSGDIVGYNGNVNFLATPAIGSSTSTSDAISSLLRITRHVP